MDAEFVLIIFCLSLSLQLIIHADLEVGVRLIFFGVYLSLRWCRTILQDRFKGCTEIC